LSQAAVMDMPAEEQETPDTLPPEDTPEAAPRHSPPQKPAGITQQTWHSLSRKGKIFVRVYVSGESAATAYETAGYDPGGTDTEHRRRNAYNVKRGKRVTKALLEYEQDREARESFERRWDLDEIVGEHERLMERAEKDGNLAVATRNLELIGRTRGLYSDNVTIDLGAQRAYTEAEQIEAARLTRLLLVEAGEPALLEGSSVADGVVVEEPGLDREGDEGVVHAVDL